MRALAKVYTSTTPECQAGGSSVLSCPFCIQRTCTISHLYILRVFSFYDSDEDGDNNADNYTLFEGQFLRAYLGGDNDFGDVYDADGDEDDDVVDISREGLCVRIPNLSRNIAPSTFCFLTPMTVMCKSISQQRFPSELCIKS